MTLQPKLSAMQEPRPCRRPPRRPGVTPEPEALEHLEVIRQTMERSATFTAVSGWGYVGMGATALVAFAVALRQPSIDAWQAVWLGEALVAVTMALAAMHWKASRQSTPILSKPQIPEGPAQSPSLPRPRHRSRCSSYWACAVRSRR